MFGMKRYNYESFEGSELLKHTTSIVFGSGPAAGEKAPDFELRSIDGDKVKLSDFKGESNVILTFGSATCPFTAASIVGIREMYEDHKDVDDVKFLFVYVREAHPGEDLPAHRSMEDKRNAAALFRDEEGLKLTILIDELDGKVHRRYGKAPNPTYIIDKSGRVAFRSLWSRPNKLRAALDELLQLQEDRGADHAVVHGGEDTGLPMASAILHSHRALERGGDKSIREFRKALGRPGRIAHRASRFVSPVALHPGRAFAGAGLAAAVIAGGLYAGYRLRKSALNRSRDPYHYGSDFEASENDYAVGI